jgi:hypothetical protein
MSYENGRSSLEDVVLYYNLDFSHPFVIINNYTVEDC